MNEYAVDTITILRFAGRDKWGNYNARTEETARGFVDEGNRVVRNINGEEVVSSTKVVFRGDFSINYEDLIRFGGVDRKIAKIGKKRGFRVEFTEVYLL